MLKHKGLILACCMALICFVSCKTTEQEAELAIQERDSIPPKPAILTTVPTIDYRAPGIKYEFEDMLLYHCLVLYDNEASGKYCVRIMDESSTAQVKITFPAGTYECLVSEKAFDAKNSAFYICIDETPYRVYPSNPPSKEWEMTNRRPVYFTISEPRTILVTIQPNSEKQAGGTLMNLDYIQFIKR